MSMLKNFKNFPTEKGSWWQSWISRKSAPFSCEQRSAQVKLWPDGFHHVHGSHLPLLQGFPSPTGAPKRAPRHPFSHQVHHHHHLNHAHFPMRPLRLLHTVVFQRNCVLVTTPFPIQCGTGKKPKLWVMHITFSFFSAYLSYVLRFEVDNLSGKTAPRFSDQQHTTWCYDNTHGWVQHPFMKGSLTSESVVPCYICTSDVL